MPEPIAILIEIKSVKFVENKIVNKFLLQNQYIQFFLQLFFHTIDLLRSVIKNATDN